MKRRILVIDGHPDPDRARLVHALADRYSEGALSLEHEVRRIDLATMGMPAAFYALWFRSHSVKSLERNILKFVGIGPVHHILYGAVEQNAAKRERWLDNMFVLGTGGG